MRPTSTSTASAYPSTTGRLPRSVWRCSLGLLVALTLAACTRRLPEQGVNHSVPLHAQTRLLICLDAGHGGEDPGAISPDETIYEKNLTLATTLMVEDHLQALGYGVMLTRRDDTFVPLDERAKQANLAEATLFVSIHYNASPNPKGHGLEVFCFEKESEAGQLAEEVLRSLTHYTKAPSRGVKEENFAVLRKTQMPAVLIEGGFLSNEEELELLTDPHYLNAIAWGIAKGIDRYLSDTSPARFERTACRLGGDRSILLSYGDRKGESLPRMDH